ncbi:pullulanase-type alpha-1,6-glucosidase [Rubrivivax albus]|nr:pullulanase-type alpha-1,6-glucosidase [Rubrivivax albus]
MPWNHFWILALGWVGFGAAGAVLPEASDCAGPASRVLAAMPADAPGPQARALWLDGRHLRWPGAKAGGTVRLHHAGTGQLRVVDGRVAGAQAVAALEDLAAPLPAEVEAAVRWAGAGRTLRLRDADAAELRRWLRGDLLLTLEDSEGRVSAHTRVQLPRALDALYAPAHALGDLGVQVDATGATMRVWAPTAQTVALCLHAPGAPVRVMPMQRDDATGSWQARVDGVRDGFYTYLADLFVPGHGRVRNRVTDPYSVGLDADSQRSWIGRLDDPRTEPPGWRTQAAPPPPRSMTDMVIYELHVRDFSRDDATVRPAWRGKYLGFTEPASDGMRHLRALADAGLTDVHLLPVFDLATVPERGCAVPTIPRAAPDSPEQQAAVAAVKDRDCYNWGYDPWHFNAPEGSFATDPDDAPGRIREFRAMVVALHAAGLRVGMDVVYNHTTAAGQHPKSVLDRVVPGYYHRLNAQGEVERSTCCDNTATEHAMMAKLMSDSVLLWARDHRIDGFRFDLMGHQPKAEMLAIRDRLRRETGRAVPLIGEGWNFGEVADGARFVQASQLELNGSGIGTFSDRARDAIRGGGAGDGGEAQVTRKGYVNGGATAATADMVRVGLAGSLRGLRMTTHDGGERALQDIAYGGGQPAGYVREPSEVVNYVENHDNQTLFDVNVFKLPPETTPDERARVQMLAAAINMFSQGVAYFHAGIETLRSKSMDRNSYDSGDWFNRVDWTLQDNFFGTGLPPAWDNEASWPWMRPLLARAAQIRPRPQDIRFARDQFLDLLRIRASTSLLRLPSAAAIAQRLQFPNTGPGQVPGVVVGLLDGRGLPDAGFATLAYVINVDTGVRTLNLPELAGGGWALHPVHRAPGAADARPKRAQLDAQGRLAVPPRTAVVFVRR